MLKYGKQRIFSICPIPKIVIIILLKYHLLKRSQDAKLFNAKNVPIRSMFVKVINSVLLVNALLNEKKHFNTFHKCLSTIPSSFKNEINYLLDEIDNDTDMT